MCITSLDELGPAIQVAGAIEGSLSRVVIWLRTGFRDTQQLPSDCVSEKNVLDRLPVISLRQLPSDCVSDENVSD